MTKEKISKKKTNSTVEKRSFFAFLKKRQAKTLLATFLMLFAIFLFSAFISFFFNWQEDQSTVKEFFNRKVATNNLLGKVGANLSHFFIYQGFGLASFIITYKIFATGYFILLKQKLSRIILSWNWNYFNDLDFSNVGFFTR